MSEIGINFDVLEQLRQGISPEEILRRARPVVAEEMRRRCALVRSFDRELYDLLREDLTDCPAFEDFVIQPDIQPIPRIEATYYLRADQCQRYAEDWEKNDPEAWVSWNAKIADFYKQLRPDDVLTRLYHLIPVDRTEAERLFREMFDEFNHSFQLQHCYGLLNILNQRSTHLGERLAQLRDQKRQEYLARALFAQEYYQTATYYHRDHLLQHVETVLQAQPDEPWIWHLCATGGMGKTMFLRWLIARRLIPNSYIPCARLDLDFIPLEVVKDSPCLLLLRIAEQLNQQIAREPFVEIINELREYSKVLDSPTTFSERLELGQEAILLANQIAESLSERLGLALHSARVGKPIVIALDTLEHATVLHGASLLRLIQEISKLRQFEPGIRMILSGRYNLTHCIDGYAKQFGSQTQVYWMEDFREEESRGYLRQRGVSDAHLIEAIVARSEGNPFKLALFAELALTQDQLTPQEVREYPRADYAYLLERVILRIPEQRLRWVVRYGVVPRQLTKPFISEVMRPYLEAALTGLSTADRPKELPAGLERYQNQDIWLAESEHPDFNVDRLWEGLLKYTSEHGWLSLSGDRSEVLRFHPDVIHPMRELLRTQEVSRQLHNSAVIYFERLAETDPDRWAVYSCEAIYHKFQLEGTTAAAYWREKLNHPKAQRQPRIRYRVATEILGKDYVNADGNPLLHEGDRAIVTLSLLVEAHYETANALISENHASLAEQGTARQEANSHLKQAEKLKRAESVPRPIGLARLIAENYQQQGEDARAIEVLEEALSRASQVNDQFDLHLALADGFARMRSDQAPQHYQSALLLQPAEFSVPTWEVRERLAACYIGQGKFADALAQYQVALTEVESAPFSLQIHYLRLAVMLCIRVGHIAEAAQLVERMQQKHRGTASFETALLEAEIQLAVFNPLQALLAHQEASLWVGNSSRNRAELAELHARILADLMDYPQALNRLKQAKKEYRKADSIPGPDRCHLLEILFHIRDLGAFAQARSLLQRFESGRTLQDQDTWMQIELLWLIALQTTGNADEASSRFQDLLRSRDSLPPHLNARLLMAGLALALLDSQEELLLRELTESLESIQPATARLQVFEILRWRCEPFSLPQTWQQQWRQHLLQLLPEPVEDSIDFLPQAVWMAEAYRVLGMTSQAVSLLESVFAKCSMREGWNVAAICKILQVWNRLSSPVPATMPDVALRLDDAPTDRSYPLLWAAILVEEGVRRFRLKHWQRLEPIVKRARQCLEQVSVPTQWLAKQYELEAQVAVNQADWLNTLNLLRQATNLLTSLGNAKEIDRLFTLVLDTVQLIPQQVSQARALITLIPDLPKPILLRVLNITRSIQNPKLRAEVVSVLSPYLSEIEIEMSRELLEEALRSIQEELIPIEKAMVVRLELSRSGAQQVVIDFEGVPLKRMARPLTLDPDFLMSSLTATRSQMLQDFVKLLYQDRRQVSNLLTTCLFTPEQQSELQKSLARAEPFDIKLFVPSPVAALPWEWIQVAHGEEMYPFAARYFYRMSERSSSSQDLVFWVQSTLNQLISPLATKLPMDGIYGPQTADALRDWKQQKGIPVNDLLNLETIDQLRADLKEHRQSAPSEFPQILILQPEIASEAVESFGYRGSGGSLMHLYWNHSLDASWIDAPTLEGLAQTLKAHHPQVIHIVGVMKQVRSEIVLDFARQTNRKSSSGSSGEDMGWSASDLGHVLKAAYRNMKRPVLILDITRPSSDTEALRQLLLRNLFASELFQVDATAGILATGLQTTYNEQQQTEIYLRLMARGEVLGDLARGVRQFTLEQLEGSELDRAIAGLGTALFTHEPLLPCLDTP